VYFTDQTGNSNLYNQLPSYFSSEVSEVLSLNENVSG